MLLYSHIIDIIDIVSFVFFSSLLFIILLHIPKCSVGMHNIYIGYIHIITIDIMRHHTGRHRIDTVLALDQFSVTRPLQPEDLDKRVTRQGIYPSLPTLNGIPWSEYVRDTWK